MDGAHGSARLSGISKSFGAFMANDDISLTLAPGSIHALVGENGAGKSTLSNILYGLIKPGSGSIEVNGKQVSFDSPRQAIEAGIGMVHQHFMLVPTLTVAENIVLGSEQTALFRPLPMRNLERGIVALSRRHGMEVDPRALVSSLSVGGQQRVEILKILYRKARILILDEPTAVLSPPETEGLFGTLRSLAAEGRSIMLITHKLDEVLAVADTVSVMRRGRLVGTMPAAAATKVKLAQMMVGRDVLLRADNPPGESGRVVLSIDNLNYATPDKRRRLQDLALKVQAGEVYGIAGVEGNGQSELLSILRGTRDPEASVSGSIELEGNPLWSLTPDRIAALGISIVPEDRLKNAVIPELGIRENLLLGRHAEQAFHRGFGFDRERLACETERLVSEYDIRYGAEGNPPLSSLSGGNQQKLVLARELERPGLRLLVLAQPTRGVDIGAIEQIHRRIIEARRKGVAILLISSELEEVISLSTRIGCLFEGTIRHEFSEREVLRGRLEGSGFEKEIGLHIT
ncbi:MAG: ABC transporter ATP-binding protein [Chlorobiaceae bacterium]|nr:ABC transporter ATP-binding protein [Chlorobiaceae bacterium]